MENTTSAENQYLPFWQTVAEKMSDETVLNIVASKAGGILTLSVIPQKADKISPAILSGSVEDFAAEFFTAAFQPPPSPQAGLNVTSAPAADQAEKKEAKKPAAPAASSAKKKAAPAAAQKSDKKTAAKPAAATAKKTAPDKAEEGKRGRGRPPGVGNKKGTKAKPVPPPEPAQLDLEKEAEKITQEQQMHPGPDLNPQPVIIPEPEKETNVFDAFSSDTENTETGPEIPANDSENNITGPEVSAAAAAALKSVKEYTRADVVSYPDWIRHVRDVAFFATDGEPTTSNKVDEIGKDIVEMQWFMEKYYEGKTVLQALTDAVNENLGGYFIK